MEPSKKYIQFYVGCDTNEGVFTGFDLQSVFIQASRIGITRKFSHSSLGQELFLFLRPMASITEEERGELIRKGFNIGRPKGYSFSIEAFLYLLSLHIDLFGLIKSGYAKSRDTNAGN